MEVYLQIGALMEKHGLTNQAMTNLTGIPLGTVSGIRSGKIQNPSFDNVCAMMKAMDESIDALVGITPPAEEADHTPPPVQQPVHFSFQPLRDDVREIAREAICRVYESEAYKNIEKNVKSWKALALAETAFIILVLLWDITHPTMGFIQYTVTSNPVTQGLLDWIRRA